VTSPFSTAAEAHHRDGDRWESRGHHHGRWVYRTDRRTDTHRRWHDWAVDRDRTTTSPHDSTKLRVHSTAYCLEGRMANGQRAHDGAAAMNGVPLGARFRVKTGPLRGEVLTVKDRVGNGSEFDVAMPDDCSAAYRYGRRTVNIQRVP
jgi:3D (Asp-Asp-Asp) domain-containing protein